MLLSVKLLLSLILLAHLVSSEKEKSGNENIKIQRAAVKAWANQLTETDYNATNWDLTMSHSPAHYFEYYIKRLSNVFEEKKASVNFALVGACDGSHDHTISEHYLKNDHWRGVFVEPFEINYNDLVQYMEKSGVGHRTHVIHGAATAKCNSTVIKMKRPTFEERNKSLPHWMRRQIGAVVPFNKLDRPATGGWTFEYVRCVNGPEILHDWALAVAAKQQTSPSSPDIPTKPDGGANIQAAAMLNVQNRALRKLRPHILKVDVEGHDYDVLMGFLSNDVPKSDLPLLISFEAKSIMQHIDALRSQLHSR